MVLKKTPIAMVPIWLGLRPDIYIQRPNTISSFLLPSRFCTHDGFPADESVSETAAELREVRCCTLAEVLKHDVSGHTSSFSSFLSTSMACFTLPAQTASISEETPRRGSPSTAGDQGLGFTPTANPDNYVPLSLVASEMSSKDSFQISVVIRFSGGEAYGLTYTRNAKEDDRNF